MASSHFWAWNSLLEECGWLFVQAVLQRTSSLMCCDGTGNVNVSTYLAGVHHGSKTREPKTSLAEYATRMNGANEIRVVRIARLNQLASILIRVIPVGGHIKGLCPFAGYGKNFTAHLYRCSILTICPLYVSAWVNLLRDQADRAETSSLDISSIK